MLSESPRQHEEHIRTLNRKERRLYNRPELGRIEEGMEGIQDRKSTKRQRQDERICDQDPQAPGRTGNKCCFIPEYRHPVAIWIPSFFLFSRLIFQHRTRTLIDQLMILIIKIGLFPSLQNA